MCTNMNVGINNQNRSNGEEKSVNGNYIFCEELSVDMKKKRGNKANQKKKKK